jgi:hypothetical protein
VIASFSLFSSTPGDQLTLALPLLRENRLAVPAP